MVRPEERLTRRCVLRLIGGAALAVPVGLRLGPAGAARAWCRADPTFSVGGLIGNVYVSGELGRRYDTTGPIKLRVRMPEGLQGELLAADNGFGHGYAVGFDRSEKLKHDDNHIDLEVEVFVPVPDDAEELPILVEFVPGNGIEVADDAVKHTNEWIKVKTRLDKERAPKAKETAQQKEAREGAQKALKAADGAAKDAAASAAEAAKKAQKAADEAAKAAAEASAGDAKDAAEAAKKAAEEAVKAAEKAQEAHAAAGLAAAAAETAKTKAAAATVWAGPAIVEAAGYATATATDAAERAAAEAERAAGSARWAAEAAERA